MKNLLIVALIAPCITFAQTRNSATDSCRPGINITYTSFHMHGDGVNVDQNDTGSWLIRNKTWFVTAPCEKRAPHKRSPHGIITAENVTLTSDGVQTLRADHFD